MPAPALSLRRLSLAPAARSSRSSRTASPVAPRALFGKNRQGQAQQEAAEQLPPAPVRGRGGNNHHHARRSSPQQLVAVPGSTSGQFSSLSQRYESAPPLVRGAIGVAAALALFAAAKRILGGGRNSMSALESRGFVGDYGDRAAPRLTSEDSYKRAMRGVNVVAMEELSDEAIAAARSRRMREREASPPDLEALATDLPADHPFAVVEEVTPEEAELAAARLRVRRGLPLRDLSGARGFSSTPSDEEEKR